MITWGKRMHGVHEKMGTSSPRWAQMTQPFPTSLRLLLKPGEPTQHGDSHTTEAQHTLHEKHLLRILSVCVCAQPCLTPVTPWTVACQAPLSMGIVQARILKWVAISFCKGSSKPRTEPRSSAAPALQAGSSPLSYPGSLRILSKRQPADSSWMLMM